jgi:hypothetical protein
VVESELQEAKRLLGQLESTVRVGSLPKYYEREYTVGVDIGQTTDYTAMVVLKKTIAARDDAMFSPVGARPDNRLVKGRPVFDVVYAKRVKDRRLTETAREVFERVVKLAPLSPFNQIGRIGVAVDGTGMGRTVIDVFRDEMDARKRQRQYLPEVDFRPVNWRGSNESMKRPTKDGDYWPVPWAQAVWPAVVAFQEGDIRIGRVADRDQLLHELKSFRMKKPQGGSGVEKYEAWRQKDHDDLLAALTLAYWMWWYKRKGTSKLRVIR